MAIKRPLYQLIDHHAVLVRTIIEQQLARKDRGLTYDQWIFLACVHHNPGLSQRKYADLTGRSKVFISKVSERLACLGYLTREKDHDDRRNYILISTMTGGEIVESVEALIDPLVDQAVKKENALPLLQSITQHLEKAGKS